MTSQNLLLGLKTILNDEFTKAHIILDDPAGGYKKPQIYIGYLPPMDNQNDFPHIVIMPPIKAEENDETQTYPIKLYCGVKAISKDKSENAFMDILTLVERTKEILKRNMIVAGAFRRIEKIVWSVDLLNNQSPDYAIGEIEVTYETVASYQEMT